MKLRALGRENRPLVAAEGRDLQNRSALAPENQTPNREEEVLENTSGGQNDDENTVA